jgi:hypothetical protein
MIGTAKEFEERLSQLDPRKADFALSVDELIGALTQETAPFVYESIFRFFEAHPAADCGAPGALVHCVEHHYPNYVPALLQSVIGTPSYNGVLMINRILNSKLSDEERSQHVAALISVTQNASAPETVRAMAKRFLARHA